MGSKTGMAPAHAGTTSEPVATLPVMSLEDLAPRVVEIEQLAALGCRLAREAMRDPSETLHAQERLQSILREVGQLIPSLELVGAPVDPKDFIAPSLANAPSLPEAEPDDEGEGEPACANEDPDPTGDDDDAEQEVEEWDLDPAKLEAALENDALMSQIPESDREWFKGLARRLIDSHTRATFATRVKEALRELYETMEMCQEANSKRLSVALTFEHLRLEKAKKLD
jgi:hypothetical protein